MAKTLERCALIADMDVRAPRKERLGDLEGKEVKAMKPTPKLSAGDGTTVKVARRAFPSAFSSFIEAFSFFI